MSRRPQVLSPDTPVREAADLMQRYGYEGYPVVEDGHLVGLLTRRAVDRTMSHKLNLTIGAVMECRQCDRLTGNSAGIPPADHDRYRLGAGPGGRG